MRLINANAIVTATVYDEEHEEHRRRELTVEDMLETYTDGCPPFIEERKGLEEDVEKIAQYYGLDAQRRLLVEECSELIQAVCKVERFPNKMRRGNLIEEMADVMLVIKQVAWLMMAEEELDEIEHRKVKRTLEQMGDKDAERV